MIGSGTACLLALGLAPAAPTRAPARPAGIVDPAPRPVTDMRIQNRYTTKAGRLHVYGGAEYLARGDFYISPGARAGVTHHPFEWLGLEAQATRYFAVLGTEAEQVKLRTGYVPDSHAPEWLLRLGARASLGYGKLQLAGGGRVLHFEPQAFAHAALHVYDGDIGPSTDAGLALLVHLSQRFFFRIEAALSFDLEVRSGGLAGVLGAVPALSFGGVP